MVLEKPGLSSRLEWNSDKRIEGSVSLGLEETGSIAIQEHLGQSVRLRVSLGRIKSLDFLQSRARGVIPSSSQISRTGSPKP